MSRYVFLSVVALGVLCLSVSSALAHDGDTGDPRFKVYTDNTAGAHNPFRIAAYPTPVPEPAAASILVLGGGAMLIWARRRR